MPLPSPHHPDSFSRPGLDSLSSLWNNLVLVAGQTRGKEREGSSGESPCDLWWHSLNASGERGPGQQRGGGLQSGALRECGLEG